MAANTENMKTGLPEAVHFDVVGKTPAQEDAAVFTQSPMAKKGVSGAEAKSALGMFFGCIALAPLMWFFGQWVIDGFVGPGVLFFGYGMAYVLAPIAVIFGIYSFAKLFRSAQKKKPERTLEWFFKVALIGDEITKDGRFGKMDLAIATLGRVAHDASRFDRNAAQTYISDFRSLLASAMDLTTGKAKGGGWHEGSSQTHLKIESTRELFPGAAEVKATLTYNDILSMTDQKNNTTTKIAAILELHIVFSLVRSGKYWYPFDIYPAVTCRRDLPDVPAQ